MKLYNKMMLGFCSGIFGGLAAFYLLPREQFPFMKPVCEAAFLFGDVFLQVISLAVVPLLVLAIILGTYELGRERFLGSAAALSVAYALIFSAIAVIIAIMLVEIIRPGAGLEFGIRGIDPQPQLDSAWHIFSKLIFFLTLMALTFSFVLSFTAKNKKSAVILALNQGYAASKKLIAVIMKLAPFAVGGLMFNTAYSYGTGLMKNLFLYFLTVVLAILLQQFVVYAAALKYIGNTSPRQYFKSCMNVYLTAFATASSYIALPLSLETAAHVLKLPEKIARFVLSMGSAANQNGTALIQAVTVLFLAQAYGIAMSLSTQIFIVVMCVLAGVGSVGVPGGALPMTAAILIRIGVPPEGIGLILGADRILDMCGSLLNVSGDLVVAKLVTVNATDKDRDFYNEDMI